MVVFSSQHTTQHAHPLKGYARCVLATMRVLKCTVMHGDA
jgi:hypothetical protein